MLTFQISKGDVSNGFQCYQLSVMKERDVMAAEKVSAKESVSEYQIVDPFFFKFK